MQVVDAGLQLDQLRAKRPHISKICMGALVVCVSGSHSALRPSPPGSLVFMSFLDSVSMNYFLGKVVLRSRTEKPEADLQPQLDEEVPGVGEPRVISK